MNDTDSTNESAEDQFETVYKVYHAEQYGFGGNTHVWIAVLEETEDRIIGRRCSPMSPSPGQKLVINKDNVAGWKEDRRMLGRLSEDPRAKTPERVRKAYERGEIDEEELEELLEEAIEQ